MTSNGFKLFVFLLLNAAFFAASGLKLYPKDFGDAVQFQAQFLDRNWTYEMKQPNKEICGPNTKALILISSAPGNVEKRRAIRETWMNDESNPAGYPAFFVIGSTNNPDIEEQVNEEHQNHGDIIRSNADDKYKLLPLKTHAALAWFQEFCSDVPYLFKLDDDVVVYLKRLDHFVQTEFDQVIEAHPVSMLCEVHEYIRPERSPYSKYHVSIQEYANSTYPSFCAGGILMISAGGVRALLEYTKEVPFLYLEDVLFYGFVAQKANVYQHQAGCFGDDKKIATADDEGVPYYLAARGLKLQQIPKAYQMLKDLNLEIHLGFIFNYHTY